MLLAPMAVEGFGNRLRIVLTAAVAMPREPLRIVFAGDDGPHDPHARLPRDVTHDLGQLHMHLLHGLLHMLHGLRRRGHEALTLTSNSNFGFPVDPRLLLEVDFA